jgi:dihydropteroate synthase
MLRVEGEADARRILGELGADHAGSVIMSSKMVHAAIAIEGVQARAANVIKQIMLSKGGECATPRDTLLKAEEPVDVIIMGTVRQLRVAVKNLSVQPFGLKALSRELKALMDGSFGREPERRQIPAGDHVLEVGGRTLVMGIINVTPDSFSDGGAFFDLETARAHAISMAAAGADVIDIGGESTRPGAEPLSQEEEERRTVPLIASLVDELDVPISIDTYKSGVASKALDAGASMVNDVSALRLDDELGELVAERGVPIILMHMQGMPRNMQENPEYDDVVADISTFLLERADHAAELGIDPDSVMIDPGIGFGKTVEHNLEIIRRLEEFRSLGYPLVLGTSRKRFIGSVTGREVEGRMMGTAASVAFAISRGVDIVRVHDVSEMVEVVKMADAMSGKSRESR